MGIIIRVGSYGGIGGIVARISSGGNDGYWDGTTLNTSNTYMRYGKNNTITYDAFLMFEGITIPAGVTILTASLELYVSAKTGIPLGTLYFHDHATPTVPTGSFTSRAKTTASASISYPDAGAWYIVDVKSIIEELLASYSYNNAKMLAMIFGAGTGVNYGAFQTYEHTGVEEATLRITW